MVSVDHAKRLVVLKRADGSQATYKAAPGAPGFDDIKAGDVVKVSVAEELAVFLGMNSVPAGAGSKRLHAGWAAMGGLAAATLATEGFRGAAAALEGRHGFFNAYSPESEPDCVLESKLGQVEMSLDGQLLEIERGLERLLGPCEAEEQ